MYIIFRKVCTLKVEDVSHSGMRREVFRPSVNIFLGVKYYEGARGCLRE